MVERCEIYQGLSEDFLKVQHCNLFDVDTYRCVFCDFYCEDHEQFQDHWQLRNQSTFFNAVQYKLKRQKLEETEETGDEVFLLEKPSIEISELETSEDIFPLSNTHSMSFRDFSVRSKLNFIYLKQKTYFHTI